MARIVSADTTAINEAAAHLRAGAVVAFPTETVYGLGARTFDEDAVTRIYELKQRPHDNPTIAHVLDADGARDVVSEWSDRAAALADVFWPGPLTMVLPKSQRVPACATGGRTTIAVRSPRHPVARALIAAVGDAISAPSANRSGHVSPTSAAHVEADFARDDLLILDGGRCEVGLESTVIDLSGPHARLLRPGSIRVPELEAVIGAIETPTITNQDAGPGTQARHYAPATPCDMVATNDLAGVLVALAPARAVVLAFDETRIGPPHTVIGMPGDAAAYGQVLYDTLRTADAHGADRIIVEEPPPGDDAWIAVRDRLTRASTR